MASFSEELELCIYAHIAWICCVDKLDTFYYFVDILFNVAFSSQVAAIIELLIADIADIFGEILSDAIG